MRNVGQPFSFLYIVAVLILSTTVLVLVLDSAEVERLCREDNLVERLTVVLYLGVIACFLFLAMGDKGFRYHSAFLVLLLTLRELDIHRKLVAGNVFKFNYYLQPSASPMEKLVAGAVVLFCAYALIRYMMTYVKTLILGLRSRFGYALTTAAVLLMLPVTKLMDATPGILRRIFAITLSYEAEMSLRLFEEMLELGIPLLILCACLQYWVFTRGQQGGPSARSL